MRLLLCCLILLAGSLASAASAQASCSVRQRAEVPLEVIGGMILISPEVNGMAATLVLDTGAERSLVTPVAVERLGLALDEWVGTTMRGVGGIEGHRNADPRSFSLGGIALQRRTVSHDTSLTVGTMPRTDLGAHRIDGLLGRDYLSLFDLEINVPAQSLTLYDVRGCAGRFLPWSGPYTAMAVRSPMASALVAAVTLDGTPLRAMIDTGASSSLLGATGMIRMGLTDDRLVRDPGVSVSGQGPRMVTMRQHRFRSMQVAGETTQLPELWVAPLRFTPIVDMLLGADWLAGKRVWISYATSQVFVAGQ